MRKHNHIRKSAALVLSLSFLLALLLSGCGMLSSTGKPAPAKDWDTTIDITEAFNDALKEALELKGNGEQMDRIKIKDFTIDVTVSVDDDGKYELTVDEKRLERTIDNVIETLVGSTRGSSDNGGSSSPGTQESFPAGLGDSRLVGDWVCSLDMTDMFYDEMVSSLGDDIEYFSFHDFIIKVNLSLGSDGTFRLSVDETALERTFNTLVDDMKNGLRVYLEELLEEEGLDMTLDEYLAYETGYTLDELAEDALAENGFDVDDFLDSASAMNISGTYVADGSELIVTSSTGSNTLPYTLSGNQLTIHSDTGGMLGDTMVFIKR